MQVFVPLLSFSIVFESSYQSISTPSNTRNFADSPVRPLSYSGELPFTQTVLAGSGFVVPNFSWGRGVLLLSSSCSLELVALSKLSDTPIRNLKPGDEAKFLE